MNKANIIRKDLSITYNIGGDCSIELETSTNEDTGDRFSILDVDQDKNTGGTTFELANIDELTAILTDFNKHKRKFNE